MKIKIEILLFDNKSKYRMNQYGKSLSYKIEEEKMKLIFSRDKDLKKTMRLNVQKGIVTQFFNGIMNLIS
jgi:hypothetical protein